MISLCAYVSKISCKLKKVLRTLVKVRKLKANTLIDVTICLFLVGTRCDRALGMMSGRIRNSLITASSQWDSNHASYLARLNHRRVANKMGAWSARSNDRKQWLQITFERLMRITKIATQGRQDTSQWVTQYYLSYSQDVIIFTDYKAKSSRWVS